MNVGRIARATALLIVCASFLSSSGESRPSGRVTLQSAQRSTSGAYASPAEPSDRQKPQNASSKLVAYYFHATFRCPTCSRIEALSHEALIAGFPKELQDGTLLWKPVNVEKPENLHFIRDYRLFTKSLVLVKMTDGKQTEWKNLTRVWELVEDRSAFLRYVQDEVRLYLAKR